jgi:hypothetical protein
MQPSMGPNDQHPYYYGSSSTYQTSQSTYENYQTRSNQYSQHNRQSSPSTPAQNYNYKQASFDNDQTQQFNNQNCYANAHDGGQRAAETLICMGSTMTYPSTTATVNNQTETTNMYNSGHNQSSTPQNSLSNTIQNQTANCPTQSSYATAQTQQARPASVNSVRSAGATQSPIIELMQHPQANTTAQYLPTQMAGVQRSASPAQIQASHQLQSLADQRAQEIARPVVQPSHQTFVDPSAVYDPWPEYQRTLAAAWAAKETEVRAAAEGDMEEKWKADEEDKEQEEEKRRENADEKERKKSEGVQRKAAAKEAGAAAPTKKRKSQDAAAVASADATTVRATAGGMNLSQLTALVNAAPSGSDAEAQIRQLMATVKQMNDKHPNLLAKIWEDERQQHLRQTASGSPVAPQAPAEGMSTYPSKKEKKPSEKAAPAAPASVSQAPAPPTQNGTTAQAKAAPPITTPSTPALAPAQARPYSAAKTAISARGIIWPPEKKDQIAAAAVRWLGGIPGNQGQVITASEIATMLDRNPTYIELCEWIEKLGFKVERAAFAKALLASVPDMNANRSVASPPIPRPPSPDPTSSKPSTLASVIQAIRKPPIPQSQTSPTQNWLPDLQLVPYESPYFDALGQPIATAQLLAKTEKATPNHNHKVMENKKAESMDADSDRPSETPGPVTKADQARKRTFADLIDLTALSDNDDLPPTKQPYFGPSPDTQPGQTYLTKLDFIPNFNGVIDPYLQQSTDRWGGGNLVASPSAERQAVAAIPSKLNTFELAKPIERKHALRRSRYDVRTLARDVLLATGKHPDLLPLNGHLEPLRTVLANTVTFNADLATLRWDLIDPGEPVPAALESIANDKDSVIDDVDDETEEEERHFTIRAPSHMVAVGADGSSNGGRVVTVDLDMRPADGAGRGKHMPSRGRGRGRGRPPSFARFSTDAVQTPLGNHTAAAPSSASPASGGVGYSTFNRDVRPDGTKRRGRPVGWRKHLHMRGGSASHGSGTPSSTKPAPLPPAAEPKFTVYKCGWQDCGAQIHNLETLRRHVEKKHGKPDKNGTYTCLWADCGKTVQNIGDDGAVTQSAQHFNFPDTSELMRHVEQSHITPIAWELGDGPPGGFSGDSPISNLRRQTG